jgi:hypothetical protein
MKYLQSAECLPQSPVRTPHSALRTPQSVRSARAPGASLRLIFLHLHPPVYIQRSSSLPPPWALGAYLTGPSPLAAILEACLPGPLLGTQAKL